MALACIGYAVVMGHWRLSIIDLSDAGKQPMANEDGTLWVIYNGELYETRLFRLLNRLEHKSLQPIELERRLSPSRSGDRRGIKCSGRGINPVTR
jgi:hypothetical protein